MSPGNIPGMTRFFGGEAPNISDGGNMSSIKQIVETVVEVCSPGTLFDSYLGSAKK